ncbi:MAG: hypothetical protein ACTSWN_03265 [Promethearchaeota archaeon]
MKFPETGGRSLKKSVASKKPHESHLAFELGSIRSAFLVFTRGTLPLIVNRLIEIDGGITLNMNIRYY